MAPGLTPRRYQAGIAIGVLVTACGSGTSTVLADVSDRKIESVAGTWVNQVGLSQTDPTMWRERLTEACTEGVWDPEVASELADRYVTEDRTAFAGGDDVPATGDAAGALWTMAVQVCRDSFPAGAVHAGPP